MSLLEVKNLHTYFKTKKGIVKAVNDVTYSLDEGKTLGIVGESGSGKSVSAMSIIKLLDGNGWIDSGSVTFNGRDILSCTEKEMYHIRGNEISVIFQEPMTSLNPVFTVGHQLMEVFRLHQGLDKKQAREKSIEALRMVNVPMPEKRVDCYPYELSGGLRQRVMIAMALACRPELLIADEPTTALDVTIQAQVLDLMCKLRDELGTAIAFITHDLGVVKHFCDRIVVMYLGNVCELAESKELFHNPLHPYTEGLKASLPERGSRDRLHVIPGSVPSALDFPKGCVFAPRCPYATARCAAEKPPLYDMGGGRAVRCFRCEEGSK